MTEEGSKRWQFFPKEALKRRAQLKRHTNTQVAEQIGNLVGMIPGLPRNLLLCDLPEKLLGSML